MKTGPISMFVPKVARAVLTSLAVLSLMQIAPAQQEVRHEDGRWVRTISGSAPCNARLRVSAHGPVTLQGGTSKELTYTVKLSVNARTEAQARRLLDQYTLKALSQGAWTTLTAPAGLIITTMVLKA